MERDPLEDLTRDTVLEFLEVGEDTYNQHEDVDRQADLYSKSIDKISNSQSAEPEVCTDFNQYLEAVLKIIRNDILDLKSLKVTYQARFDELLLVQGNLCSDMRSLCQKIDNIERTQALPRCEVLKLKNLILNKKHMAL